MSSNFLNIKMLQHLCPNIQIPNEGFTGWPFKILLSNDNENFQLLFRSHFYLQSLFAPQRHLYLHLGDAFNCHLALSWLNSKAQAEGMLSGLMRPLVKEGCCVGTTKGCSLNSPPVDQSGPAGIWWAEGAHTVSPSLWGCEGLQWHQWLLLCMAGRRKA